MCVFRDQIGENLVGLNVHLFICGPTTYTFAVPQSAHDATSYILILLEYNFFKIANLVSAVVDAEWVADSSPGENCMSPSDRATTNSGPHISQWQYGM